MSASDIEASTHIIDNSIGVLSTSIPSPSEVEMDNNPIANSILVSEQQRPDLNTDWGLLYFLWDDELCRAVPSACSNNSYGLLCAAKFLNFAVDEINLRNYKPSLASNQIESNVLDDPSAVGLDFNLSSTEMNITSIGARIIEETPSRYSIYQIVILAMIMTAMMIVIVIGNILVVIATATESNLASVQNWFIASLAVADMLIGLVIMPFSLSYELMGYWMFGTIWCDIHQALDVLCSTASIMNICLISLDRYWSITKAIAYLNTRTPRMVIIMITTTWALSLLICIPPLLGWKEYNDIQWFLEILSSQGNRNHIQFLYDIQSNMSLSNITEQLNYVVYPQCMVSQESIKIFDKNDYVRLVFMVLDISYISSNR